MILKDSSNDARTNPKCFGRQIIPNSRRCQFHKGRITRGRVSRGKTQVWHWLALCLVADVWRTSGLGFVTGLFAGGRLLFEEILCLREF